MAILLILDQPKQKLMSFSIGCKIIMSSLIPTHTKLPSKTMPGHLPQTFNSYWHTLLADRWGSHWDRALRYGNFLLIYTLQCDRHGNYCPGRAEVCGGLSSAVHLYTQMYFVIQQRISHYHGICSLLRWLDYYNSTVYFILHLPKTYL